MQIHNASILWNFGWGNHPDLFLFVDDIPCVHDMVHEVKEVKADDGKHATLYHSVTEDGYVHFLAHDHQNEKGFGGAIIPVRTKDGIKLVKGPWTSNPQAMHKAGGFPLHVAVTLVVGCPLHGRQYGGTVTLAVAEDAIKRYINVHDIYADIVLRKIRRYGGYEVRFKSIVELDPDKDIAKAKAIARGRLNIPDDHLDKAFAVVTPAALKD